MDDGNTALTADVSAGLRSRVYLKADHTAGKTVCGIQSQLVTAASKTFTTGVFEAAYVFNQIGTTLELVTSAEHKALNVATTMAGTNTIGSGCLLAGIDVNIRGTATISNSGTCAGIMVRSLESVIWPIGLQIVDGGATTGIQIGNCTTGIAIDGTGATASAKALTTAGWSLTNGNLTDGVGAVEVDLTLTGTVAGHVSALSSWINMSSVTTGGNYVCAQSNGLWSASGGILTNGVFIFGMRAQCLLQTNGGASGAKFYPFSIVNNTNVTTALMLCNAGSSDVGTTAVSKTTEGKYVPLYEDDAGVHYVLIYN